VAAFERLTGLIEAGEIEARRRGDNFRSDASAAAFFRWKLGSSALR
jgi:hypothetical protein